MYAYLLTGIVYIAPCENGANSNDKYKFDIE